MKATTQSLPAATYICDFCDRRFGAVSAPFPAPMRQEGEGFGEITITFSAFTLQKELCKISRKNVHLCNPCRHIPAVILPP
ncbi:MAG: hypothetical protein IJ659_07390 [Alloprevotella sp.]|nr:hypothetical protein [Alloprevotella sp.]